MLPKGRPFKTPFYITTYLETDSPLKGDASWNYDANHPHILLNNRPIIIPKEPSQPNLPP